MVLDSDRSEVLLRPGSLEGSVFRTLRQGQRIVFEVEEDDAENLLQALEKELMRRRFGPPVRLEVEESIDPYVLNLLRRELKVSEAEVYPLPGPLDLTGLFGISRLDRPELKYPKFVAGTHRDLAEVESASAPDIFAALRERDVLLHHPYDSFSTSVQAFLEQAAADPDVLAIKQTLYRTSGDSPIVDALIDAAESGKQVLVLVEIKARFDEQANIKWARKLEEAGCHVVYGLVGLKTHCKLSLVVRQEGDTLARYSHVGTGNYHPKTARLYEDYVLLTADQRVGEDRADLFKHLSGYAKHRDFTTLLVAPDTLRTGLVGRIHGQAERAAGGQSPELRIVLHAEEMLVGRLGTRIELDADPEALIDHAARPDVVAAAHAHSLYGKTLSSLPMLLEPLTQDACAFYGDHARFDDFSGVVLDVEEGKKIAHALGDNKAVILRNHGLLTVGYTVDEAAWWFITMERSCQAQLAAMAAGTPLEIRDEIIEIVGRLEASRGGIGVGPDGNLYISTGDNVNPFESQGFTPIDERPGREAFDAQRTSANTNDPNGKVLRITPNPDGPGPPRLRHLAIMPAHGTLDARPRRTLEASPGRRMYEITRELHFCYGHRLLDYQGKCAHLHGHNGVVVLTLQAADLDAQGMVADFQMLRARLGEWLDSELDHRMILRRDDPALPALLALGEPLHVGDFNPTAENLARLVFDKARALGLPVRAVRFVETPTCWATYEP